MTSYKNKKLDGNNHNLETQNEYNKKQMILRICTLAIPIALQNLINVGVGVTDTLMIGSISEEQLSGISYANQPYFIFTTVLFGLASGANVLTAQYWGRKETQKIKEILGLMLRIGLIVGFLVSLFVLSDLKRTMSIFTNQADVIEYGAIYLKIVGFSYIFSAFTGVFLMGIRSIGNVTISMRIYGISFVLNVFLNYILIFGKLGLPRLEIMGAAIATLISRILESVLTLIYMYRFEDKLRFRLHDIFYKTRKYWHTLVRYSVPVLLSEVSWGLGISVQTAIIGRLGVSAITATSFISQVQQLLGIVIIGFGIGAGIVIGNIIGEGREQVALHMAKDLLKISFVLGSIVVLGVMALRPIAPNFIECSEQTADLIRNMLFVSAYLLFFEAFSILTMAGILRGSGDTIFCTTLDVVTLFFIKLGLGYLTAMVLKMDPVFVYFVLSSDECFKALLTIPRIRRGKWIHHTTIV